MKLGAFSLSLSVKDLSSSMEFYEKLGFKPVGGEAAQNWMIMRSGSTTIGLFQGMFEKNIITFNPGWDENGMQTSEFDDVRNIQKSLKKSNIKPLTEVVETESGPGNFIIEDPDGNTIMFDQHV